MLVPVAMRARRSTYDRPPPSTGSRTEIRSSTAAVPTRETDSSFRSVIDSCAQYVQVFPL